MTEHEPKEVTPEKISRRELLKDRFYPIAGTIAGLVAISALITRSLIDNETSNKEPLEKSPEEEQPSPTPTPYPTKRKKYL